MEMVDYAYYLNSFGGKRIPEGEFQRVMEEAEVILAALLYPVSARDLSVLQEEAYRRALCYEAEYLRGNTVDGGLSHGAVKSEKVGDCTVAYRAPAERSVVSVNGMEVSPTAVSLLGGVGLMVRWV